MAQAKEVVRSPLTSPVHKSFSPPLSSAGATPEEEEQVLVRRLVDECYANHRRAFFGGLPPEQCKLCMYTNGECGGVLMCTNGECGGVLMYTNGEWVVFCMYTNGECLNECAKRAIGLVGRSVLFVVARGRG